MSTLFILYTVVNKLNNNEIWKDYTGEIEAFHGLIRVSNMGRIYKIGTNTSKNNSKILSCTKSSQGYIRMHVSIDGKIYNKPVHRLVAETFCSNPDNKLFVDHINAIRADNRASNLRWVTSSENNSNPHYIEKLSRRKKEELAKHNYLADVLKKPVKITNIDGKTLYFDEIKDVNEYFNTKDNLGRIIRKGTYVTSSKSKLKGWKIELV